MATLTQTAQTARNIIKYTGISLVAYIFLRYSIVYGWALYKYLNPPPPEPPTVGFGQLPPIKFPENPGYSYQFDLETPTGTFPEFSDRANVYYMPYQKASLLAADEAKDLASSIGFSTKPNIISEEVYEWRETIPAPLTLTTNIVDGSFMLEYQWQSDNNLQSSARISGREQSLNQAQQYLQTINQFQTDININSTQTTYLKSSGNRLIPAISLSEAEFVKIDFFRSSINDIPVVTPDPNYGIISLITTNAQDNRKQMIYLDYNYFPVNYFSEETYPLKNISLAWQELQQGQGYMAQIEGDPEVIYIRRIYLAYYDAKKAQQFLQPVYVFTGDDGTNNDIIAYVPALDQSMIKSSPTIINPETTQTQPIPSSEINKSGFNIE